jgi:hypothetical protein
MEQLLKCVPKNNNLQFLRIRDSPLLTSEGIKQITRLTRLSDISLIRCSGVKNGLRNLKSFSLLKTYISKEAFSCIQNHWIT